MSWLDSVANLFESAGGVYADVESAKAKRESLELQQWRAEQDAAIRGSIATSNTNPSEATAIVSGFSNGQIALLGGSLLLLVGYLIAKK